MELTGEKFNNCYDITGWILCVTPHIEENFFKNAHNKHHIQVNNVIKSLFSGSTENSYMKLLIRFGVNIKNSIIRMILLTVMNLYGTVKIFVMVVAICYIRNTL